MCSDISNLRGLALLLARGRFILHRWRRGKRAPDISGCSVLLRALIDQIVSMEPKQILILGGGFAGVYTARYLEKLLRPEQASITLVNRENYWVYQPMLPEVISGSIGLTNVVSPIRRFCPRTNLVMRDVEDIDLKNQIVTIGPGFRPRLLQLKYDYLVIALGTVTNFYGMPGLIENALPFRTLADAMVLRNHLIHVLEEADVEENPELRRKLLTFVVGGGGFSGVEVMAELNDFVHAVKKNYLRLRNEPHRCVIVQAGDRILPEMSEPLAVFAERILRKRGVEILLKDKLLSATSERAILGSGIEIPCKTLISTVPSALPPALQKLDCAKERGKLLVNTGLELKGTKGGFGRSATVLRLRQSRERRFRLPRSTRFGRPLRPPSTSPPIFEAEIAPSSPSKVLEPLARWAMAPQWLKFSASSCPDLSRGSCGVVFT